MRAALSYRSPKAIWTLAFYLARQAAKAQLHAQGRRRLDITAAELTSLARALQPTFIDQARAWGEQFEREHQAKLARQRQLRSNINNHAQRLQRCETTTNPVQISGAK